MLSDLKLRLDELSSKHKALADEIDSENGNNLLNFYVRIVPRLLDAERCSVFVHDPENGKVWLKAGTGITERGIEVPVNGSIVGDVIASGKPAIVVGLQSRSGMHKNVDAETGFVTREIICVPVRSKDRNRITGAIEVLNKKSGGGFTQEDQTFLEEVGVHLQNIVDSVFLSQAAIGMSKKLITITIRAIVVSFIALATSAFALVFLSVFAGLPLLFV